MVFNHFAKDTITIIKSDGTEIENIKANVQSDKIFIHDKTLLLEDGDKITRILPNGLSESYIVLDNGFYHGGNGLPGGYQAKVRKETRLNSQGKFDANNVFHINASSSNININPNNSHINNSIYENNIFSKIRIELDSKINDPELKLRIMPLLSELEQAKGTPGFFEKYNVFISSLANHVTIMAPFLPELAKMFT